MAARVDKTAGVKVLASRIVIDPFLPLPADDYDIHRDGRRLCDSASRKPDAGPRVTTVLNWLSGSPWGRPLTALSRPITPLGGCPSASVLSSVTIHGASRWWAARCRSLNRCTFPVEVIGSTCTNSTNRGRL